MERAALLGRLTWQIAEVVGIAPETATVKTLVLAVPDWPGHHAGQHVDVRLTAEDGYQAVRSYSIASAPTEQRLRLTVEELPEGEVSPFLVEDVRPGDRLEVRGPIGGYFVWEPAMGGPLLLVGGGSGIVPLMAMLRQRVASGSDVPVRMLLSFRTPEDVIYRQELDGLAQLPGIEVIYTFTRFAPPSWSGYRRRVDLDILSAVAWPANQRPLAYVCGPTGFVEMVAENLLLLNYNTDHIRTERFGPTG